MYIRPLLTCFLLCFMSRSFAQTTLVKAPIYLNFVTHNELTDKTDYEKDEVGYKAVTQNVRDFANLVMTNNVRWNFQTCSKYLLGVVKWENATTNTSDILEYMDKSTQIDVDARGKIGLGYNQNIADVAYLLKTIGVNDSKTVGGFLYSPASKADWEQFQTEIKGVVYPTAKWQADIIWGGGTTDHNNDLQNFGVWKPKNASNFLIHEPNNHLWVVGNGCSNVLFSTTSPDSIFQNIKQFAKLISTGSVPSNKFYSMTIMTNQRDFSLAFTQKIKVLIDSLAPLAKEGKVVWATINEKLNYFKQWSQQTSNTYAQYSCSEIPAMVALPVANFSASKTSIKPGESIMFTDASTNNPTSWNWSFVGGTPNASTDKSPKVRYSTTGSYSVTLTVSNAGGSNTLTKTNYITVKKGTNFSFNDNGLNIVAYPNPSSDYLNIALSEPPNPQAILQIFNVLGQEVFVKKSIEQEEIMEVSGWKKGIYLLRIQDNDRVEVIKVMVQ